MTPGTTRKICLGLWDSISTSISGIIRHGRGRGRDRGEGGGGGGGAGGGGAGGGVAVLRNRFIEALGNSRNSSTSSSPFSCLGSRSKSRRFSTFSSWTPSQSVSFFSKRQFFTNTFPVHPHTLVSSPRGRYVLSRGFASGFMAWQSVTPPAPAAVESIMTPAAAASSSITSTIAGVPGRELAGCPNPLRVAEDMQFLSSLAMAGWKRHSSTTSKKQQTRGRVRSGIGAGGKSTSRKVDSKARGSGISNPAVGGKYSKGPSGEAGNSSSSGGGSGHGSGDWKPPPRRGKQQPNGKSRPFPTVPVNAKKSTSNVDPGILGRIAQIHRPTKDEMLAAATGFFERLRIRTKWVMIRQMRPYNLEDIMAFFSWLFVGHVLWIVLGTTTFLSIAILLVNTVFAQG